MLTYAFSQQPVGYSRVNEPPAGPASHMLC